MASLIFLGQLEDVAGASEMHMTVADGTALIDLVSQVSPSFAQAVNDPRIRIAVNGELIPDWHGRPVKDADEIAFLSAVSGG